MVVVMMVVVLWTQGCLSWLLHLWRLLRLRQRWPSRARTGATPSHGSSSSETRRTTGVRRQARETLRPLDSGAGTYPSSAVRRWRGKGGGGGVVKMGWFPRWGASHRVTVLEAVRGMLVWQVK